MEALAKNLLRLFRGFAGRGFAGNNNNAPEMPAPANNARSLRYSAGLCEFIKIISGMENLCILDLGPTSPRNIDLLTRMGHRVYNEDVLLASADPASVKKRQDGTVSVDAGIFFAENLTYSSQQFDAVLCWDVPDYLDESLVKPAIERIFSALKPGGVLLAYFHTRDAGADAPCYRYHIAGYDVLEMQRGPQFRLQRIFNNRHIESLFRGCASIKFFLARDHVREVLVVR